MKAIIDFPNYFATQDGRIFSIPRLGKKGRQLKPRKNKDGYSMVALYNDHVRLDISVHRLIAMTFLSNSDEKPEVNHKNGNKSDNSVENLEWVTHSENVLHAFRTGLKIPVSGKRHGNYNPTLH